MVFNSAVDECLEKPVKPVRRSLKMKGRSEGSKGRWESKEGMSDVSEES